MNIETNEPDDLSVALAALKEVDDPEIGLNIVDLGLVYRIEFEEEDEKQIKVDMTLTTQFCPMGESIIGEATQKLSETFPEYKVSVNLTFSPPWNSEMISDDGHAFLNS